MAHKLTQMFKKHSPFQPAPKDNIAKEDPMQEVKKLIADIDKRLTSVEKTLKQMLKEK